MERESKQRLFILIASSLILGTVILAGGLFWKEHPLSWLFEASMAPSRRSFADTPLSRAAPLSSHFRENELALIFLTNHGHLSPRLREELGATGVFHLIAISAGQLLPVLAVADRVMCRLLLTKSPLSIPSLSLVRLFVGFLITGTLSLLYGLTGSLVRVLLSLYAGRVVCLLGSLISLAKLSKDAKPSEQGLVLTRLEVWLFETLLRDPHFPATLVIGLIFLLGRNLLTDWSFLYASLGAGSCALGARLVFSLRQVMPLPSGLLENLITLIAIQLVVSTLLWPLTPVFFPVALAANLLMAPLIAFVVVPPTVTLSLLAAMGLENETVFAELVSALIRISDWGLRLFTATVGLMHELSPAVSGSLLKPFSQGAYRYAVGLLVAIWLLPCLVKVLASLCGTLTKTWMSLSRQASQQTRLR